jgi:CheY-like chemotaxis protein
VYPFLILSDINMPRLNGFELKRIVQTDVDLARKSIPFVFFSTNANKKSVDSAFEMAVQGYFVKPGNYDSLKSTIRSIIEYWKSSYSPSRYQD